MGEKMEILVQIVVGVLVGLSVKLVQWAIEKAQRRLSARLLLGRQHKVIALEAVSLQAGVPILGRPELRIVS